MKPSHKAQEDLKIAIAAQRVAQKESDEAEQMARSARIKLQNLTTVVGNLSTSLFNAIANEVEE